MKVSYNWLKDYVDVKTAPDRLATVLTMAGMSVDSVDAVSGDHIFETEITANRPDWLSMIGVAREIAAITGGRLKVPPVPKSGKKAKRPAFSVKVEEPGLCPRYTARIIRGVKVAPSPDWLKKRIEAAGLRSINNIVDITNFCLFETGEPMHAFDLGKLSGGGIFVRKARAGEKLTVIEGHKKELDASMLVIADGEGPVAIAGIMGGIDTEVTFSTTDILLEAASFDPVSIRRASRKLNISTESSYRFERRVDPGNIVYSSDRAAALILKLAGGAAEELIDAVEKGPAKRTLTVRPGRVNGLLGTDIPLKRVADILRSLGFVIKKISAGALVVAAPSFRNDIKREIDVIEEISRIYGYDNIPSTVPALIDQPVRIDRDMAVKNRIRSCLAALGMNEIITYSLISRRAAASSGMQGGGLAEVQNPLTTEQEIMRPSLIPGMLQVFMWNINRKNRDLRLFELGNIYGIRPDGQYSEKTCLSIGIAGSLFAGWAGGDRAADFFELKGIVETLLSETGLNAVSFRGAHNGSFASTECAEILSGEKILGIMGRIGSRVAGNFDIKENVYILEMDAEALFEKASLEKRFFELPRYPSVYRDISIVVSKDAPNAELVLLMKRSAGAVLKDAILIDRYEGRQVPDGKLSLTYRLEYRSLSKTLEEKEVLEVHSRVLQELEDKFGAKLR